MMVSPPESTATPLVSIVIPVFNRREHIHACVESALAQCASSEILIFDNHSDDGTWEVIQKYKSNRCRVFRNSQNVGLFGNFDKCGAAASGKYTIFLCSDDRLAPGFVEWAASQLEERPEVVVLSSAGIQSSSGQERVRKIAVGFEPGEYVGKSVRAAWFWSNYAYGDNPLNYPSGVMLRTDVMRQCLPFDASIGGPADVDLFLRMCDLGNLLVTDTVGCHVARGDHQEGTKYRKAGTQAFGERSLYRKLSPGIKEAHIRSVIEKQFGALAFAAIVRASRHSFRSAIEMYRAFDLPVVQIMAAVVRRVCFRALAAFGIRWSPYLVRVVT